MKIIISEYQKKLLHESKKEQVQTLVDMAVHDYVEGCYKSNLYNSHYTSIQPKLCKGFKKGSIKLKVTDIDIIKNDESKKEFGKNKKMFFVKLSIITNEPFGLENEKYDYSTFEIKLIDLVSKIIGSTHYWFVITKVEVEENQDTINENKEMDIRLKRRFSELEKIEDIIEYQTEIQNPHNFDNGDEYSDFCIGQGLSFYYNDEEYEEDYSYPPKEMVEIRYEVEEYLDKKYHDYLVDIYNQAITNRNKGGLF